MRVFKAPVRVLAVDGRPEVPDAEFGILNQAVPRRCAEETTCGCCHLVLADHLVVDGTCLDCAA